MATASKGSGVLQLQGQKQDQGPPPPTQPPVQTHPGDPTNTDTYVYGFDKPPNDLLRFYMAQQDQAPEAESEEAAWAALSIHSVAKVVLRQALVKASVAQKMVEELGFSDVRDLVHMTPAHVSKLGLKPLEEAPLLRLLKEVQIGWIGGPRTEDTPIARLELALSELKAQVLREQSARRQDAAAYAAREAAWAQERRKLLSRRPGAAAAAAAAAAGSGEPAGPSSPPVLYGSSYAGAGAGAGTGGGAGVAFDLSGAGPSGTGGVGGGMGSPSLLASQRSRSGSLYGATGLGSPGLANGAGGGGVLSPKGPASPTGLQPSSRRPSATQAAAAGLGPGGSLPAAVVTAGVGSWPGSPQGMASPGGVKGGGASREAEAVGPADSPEGELTGHNGYVTSVATTPDGRFIVSGGGDFDRTLRVWDARTLRCAAVVTGHLGGIHALTPAPDSRHVLSGGSVKGDYEIRLWDMQAAVEAGALIAQPHIARARSLSNSHGGSRNPSRPQSSSRVTAGGHPTNGNNLGLGMGSGPALTAPASPSKAASLGTLGVRPGVNLTYHQRLQAEEMQHTDSVTSLAVMQPGGAPGSTSWRYVLSASDDRTLRLWDAEERNCIEVFAGHTDLIRAVAPLPGGSHAITGSCDKTLRVWDIQAGKCCSLLTHAALTSWVNALAIVETGGPGGTGGTTTPYLGPSGSFYGSTGAAGGGRAIQAQPSGSFSGWSGGGGGYGVPPAAWAACYIVTAHAHGPLKIWDPRAQSCMGELRGGHEGSVNAVVAVRDVYGLGGSAGGPAKYAISGGADGMLCVWDLSMRACRAVLHGHTKGVTSLAALEGGRLVSGGEDGVVRIWDLKKYL